MLLFWRGAKTSILWWVENYEGCCAACFIPAGESTMLDSPFLTLLIGEPHPLVFWFTPPMLVLIIYCRCCEGYEV